MTHADEEVLKLLKRDPISVIIEVARSLRTTAMESMLGQNLELCIEDFALLQTWIKKEGWEDESPTPPEIDTTDKESAESILYEWAGELLAIYEPKKSNQTLENSLNRYQSLVGTGDFYELTDGDIDRIQSLINELRSEIDNSPILEDDHKRRLLRRLEKLQSELHKRMSDYDRAYGVLLDGVALTQKFGESVKPITELISEISNLFWRSQARGLELPGDAPLPLLSPTKE